jgi:hypothetical protein
MKAINLFLILIIAGIFLQCSVTGPEAPEQETGSLAPKILYKSSASEGLVGLPSDVIALAQDGQVRVMVTPDGQAPIVKEATFNVGEMRIDNIPAGHANVQVTIMNSLRNDLCTGNQGVEIAPDIENRPEIGVQKVLYPYQGWVYGIIPGQTRIKVFPAGTGTPSFANLPGGLPVANWFFDGIVVPNTTFNLGQLPVGKYWLYAYNNYDNTDNWNNSFKRAIYTVTLQSDRLNGLIVLDFNGDTFTNFSEVTAVLTDNTPGGEYFAESYLYNENYYLTYGEDVFLGIYYAGTDGNLSIANMPSIGELNAYFGLTPTAGSDYLYLMLWCDENLNGEPDVGDSYYDNANMLMEFELGDVTSDRQLGNIPLDYTFTGVAKRPALGKKRPAGIK